MTPTLTKWPGFAHRNKNENKPHDQEGNIKQVTAIQWRKMRLEMCLIWFFCQWYEKLNCKGISLLRNQKGHYWYLLILLSPYNLCLLLCPSLHKMSLGISNFLEEISSLSYYIVFLYFYALITEEVFLISPCYSLKLCIQMGISFLFSFAFHFSSFHSYL